MIKMKLIQKFLPKGYLVTNLYEKSIYKQNCTTTRIKTDTFQL